MRITLLAYRRRVRVAIGVAVFAVSLIYKGSVRPLTASSSQGASVPSSNLEILEVRPSFYVIVGTGSNIGVQIGDDGVVVIDGGATAEAPAVLAAIKRISPKPIRYIIDTGPDADHVGGNE